ncbi:putative ribonuclease H-like domain-containing protein [Tanacetum coccineum]
MKFYKKAERRVRIDGKAPIGFNKKNIECYKCHNTGHFARECTSKGTSDGKKKKDSIYQDQEAGKQEKNQIGLLTMDDGVVNWGDHNADEETNHGLMAISSNSEVNKKLKYLPILELRIGMKAVKDKDQLKKTVDSWKESSKNLWKLIDSGMTLNSKVGLGYDIQSNNEVLGYEEEMNCSVFKCTEEDYVNKPLYSRFTKPNNFKGVPHPLSGDYTSKPQEEIDESLYIYGKKGPQEPEPSVLDDRSSECSTCQSNDSVGSIGTSSEHSFDPDSEISRVPQEVYVSKPVTINEKGVSAPRSKEVEPSCVTHIKTPRQPIKDKETPKKDKKNWNAMMERELGEGYSFIQKKCFVCGSLSHLIKDCDYYEKKIAREAEIKKQRVLNTGNERAKSVWNNANRVNHANHFVPRLVQLNAVRPNFNFVRSNVNTGRANVNSVRRKVNTDSFNVNPVRPKQPVPTSISKSFSPVRPQDHPLKNIEDRGIFDSGCSGHMTGNKDHLEDFEEIKEGSVTFGGSKGYITGKGRIKVDKVFFTETECLVVSPDFKMPDENQILLKVFFLATNDETSGILQNFIRQIENQLNHKVKIIRSDNGTEFKSGRQILILTATASTLADGTLELRATIDTIEYTITGASIVSIRSKLQLADASGITMLPNTEVFEGMENMGYPTDGSFTFWKSFFTPQWRFLVHHILHCISSKSGGWDQFGSNIATALICLSTGRVYNFSKLIFDAMVANLTSKTKFLMYSRFLQMILDIQTENKHPYLAVTLTKKIFRNMKRGFRGAPRPLLPAMLLVATTNPNAGQEHPDVAQSQPSSSTIPVPSTSLPPEQSPPPIPTPIPASTPTPIPETDPEPMEHTFEEPSPAHQHFSPP